MLVWICVSEIRGSGHSVKERCCEDNSRRSATNGFPQSIITTLELTQHCAARRPRKLQHYRSADPPESGAADDAVLKRLRQRTFIDETAPRRVDQNGVLPHHRQLLGADQISGIVRQRCM
jgi:hypothetical protein